MNKLYQWYEKAELLRKLKAEEIALRKEVFGDYFPEPKEGTNRVEVEGDAELVAEFPYNYKVDADSVDEGLKHVPKTYKDKLVVWKPSLSIEVYRQLSKKAQTGFTAECLTITPGSPRLTIVPKAGG